MSYVGKILVVIQLVLSLLFMTFAGAVFTVHQNWRAKHDQLSKTLDSTRGELNNFHEELVNARREFETKLAEEIQKAGTLDARNKTLEVQVTQLTSQNEQLQQQQATQTGLAESKAQEAMFRQQEAEKQRVENSKMQTRLDELAGENRELRDTLFVKEEAYRVLNRTYESGLARLAFLTQVVSKAGLETNPEVVAKQAAPAPPVDGLVTRIRTNRANRVEFVEISLGSDDGLVKGNEMDLIRVIGQDRSEWLGRIRIVDLGPDWAVGEVILPSKNGIIKGGDNVTTKLRI